MPPDLPSLLLRLVILLLLSQVNREGQTACLGVGREKQKTVEK